jgi:hypothetical protein
MGPCARAGGSRGITGATAACQLKWTGGFRQISHQRLLAGLNFEPRRIIIDGPRSYGVAQREFLPDEQH